MAGTGNSTPQAGDAGVIPVLQAGETPEASVYRPPHKWEESDIQNVSQRSSVESLPQQQGGMYAHSTPLRPTQVMSLCMERVGDYQLVMQLTQYQASTPKWSGKGNIAASEMEQVQYAPQVGSSQEMSGQQPQIGHKSLASGLVDQPA
ncbi:hypothetical protein C0995_012540 [Termitomyces sp. Mi166|nr:hypothetical protein C0995_012540 [Termitomyces sp. Mi166\